MIMHRKFKEKYGMFKSESIVLVIITMLFFSQVVNAVQWEPVVGLESPGVIILNERPWCWFSPSHFGLDEPYDMTISYRTGSSGRIIEYHADGIGNGYPIETHVYQTFKISKGYTRFFEDRYYPVSGYSYHIEVSDVTYNAEGLVEEDYSVHVIEIPPVISISSPPLKITDPKPYNGATDLLTTVYPNWPHGNDVTSYDVYFGTDSTLGESEYRGNQTEPIYDPGVLQYDTTYYWRVDAKNDWGTTPGDVWSFQTMKFGEGKIVYVDDDATGASDGSSWDNAYNYLQDALVDAKSAPKPVEIWVAQGVYKPDRNSAAPDGTGRRTARFELITDVVIRGGYAGVGGPDPNARDITANETILSGDLASNDADVVDLSNLSEEPTREENSYHVVYAQGLSGVLDGFIVSDGNTKGATSSWYGGGMYINTAYPTIVNCTFVDNSAHYDNGGGIYIYGGNPIIINCVFSANFAGSWVGTKGGGLCTNKGNPMIFRCKFIGNHGNEGGGVSNIEGKPTLIDCMFIRNKASDGGGMFNGDNKATLIGCIFLENQAGEGGGIYNQWGEPTLVNCIFELNSAASGGGMYNQSDGSAILKNCAFFHNSAMDSVFGGGGLHTLHDNTLKLTQCLFVGNRALNRGGGISTYGDNIITLNNCSFSGNSADFRGGGIYSWKGFRGDRLKLHNCRFSGNFAKWGGGICTYDETLAILINCTFAQNSGQYGNAIACNSVNFVGPMDYSPCMMGLINCILWDGGNEIWTDYDSVINIAYSNVQGGQAGVYDPCESFVWDKGNIDIDPLFANLGHWDPNDTLNDPNDDIWIDGDYHLKSEANRWDPNSESWIMDEITSPCIDAGDPNTFIGNELFPNGGRINMGVYGGTAEGSKSTSAVGNIRHHQAQHKR